MTEELVLLECITDNPYQPRTIDNAEHIENLARSIAADGLLQKPTARHTAECAQLAFGHSRRKAFEWLRVNWDKEGLPERYNNYTQIPLNFEDLTDEEMYRFAVSENVQRKDLDAIEIARAMAVYRDQFGKTSAEIGALFGMNDATVRGKLALLKLPESVTSAVSAGTISEGAARLLNSLNKVLPESVDEALADIIGDPSDEFNDPCPPADAVENALRESKKIVELRQYNSPWKDEKKFPNKYLVTLNVNQALKAISVEADYSNKQVMSNLIETLTKTRKINATYFGDERNALIAHLVNPSACSACDYRVTVDGSAYCGLKLCWERKNAAWLEAEIQQASKDTGIAIYDEADGVCALLSSFDKEHTKLFDARDASLRLVRKSSNYRNFDGIPNSVSVGLIGETAQKMAKKAEQRKAREDAQRPAYGSDEYKALEAKREAIYESIRRFGWEVCAPLFDEYISLPSAMMSIVLDQLSSEPTPDTVDDDEELHGKALLEKQRQEFGYRLLFGELDWETKTKVRDHKTPVQVFAKWTQGVLTTWGVKQPNTFLEMAKEYEYQAVSAETKAGKK